MSVATQRMRLFEMAPKALPSFQGLGLDARSFQATSTQTGLNGSLPSAACERYLSYELRGQYRVSTSRFGTGQVEGSNQTPVGLHRVARKIGSGWPIGTVFRGRQAVGFTWRGQPNATIVHRILWLEGLEPGFNRGGRVDTFRRYIYVHGFGDETTLGRPQSHGCIHMAGADLIPLFDLLPVGTLVWIAVK